MEGSTSSRLRVESLDPRSLRNFPSDTFERADWAQVERLSRSMREEGWNGDPIVVRRPDILLHGFHRAHAAVSADIQAEAVVVDRAVWEWCSERTTSDEEASELLLELHRNGQLTDLDEDELRQARQKADDEHEREMERIRDVLQNS